MKRLNQSLAAAFLAFAATAAGQQVQGPVMGYVVDSRGHQIRPLLGVPGAAVVGPAVETDSRLTADAVAPRGNYAVVRSRETQLPALWLAAGTLQPLNGLPPGVSRVAVSPEGSAAAFYYEAENRVRVVSGLPEQPSAVSEIYLNSLRGALDSFAVSDDGQLLLCAEAVTESGAAAVVLNHVGELNRIPFAGAISVLTFAGTGHDAVLASGSQAVLIRSVDVPGSRVLLGAGDLGTITAAAVSSDGQSVILAAADSAKIAVVSTTPGTAPAIIDCACSLEGLYRINDHGAYRLGGYAGATIRVLDTAVTPPRIVMVAPPLKSDNSK